MTLRVEDLVAKDVDWFYADSVIGLESIREILDSENVDHAMNTGADGVIES